MINWITANEPKHQPHSAPHRTHILYFPSRCPVRPDAVEAVRIFPSSSGSFLLLFISDLGDSITFTAYGNWQLGAKWKIPEEGVGETYIWL